MLISPARVQRTTTALQRNKPANDCANRSSDLLRFQFGLFATKLVQSASYFRARWVPWM
jgi:hypothetical protein